MQAIQHFAEHFGMWGCTGALRPWIEQGKGLPTWSVIRMTRRAFSKATLLKPILGQQPVSVQQWHLGIDKSLLGDRTPNQASELGPQENNTEPHLQGFS